MKGVYYSVTYEVRALFCATSICSLRVNFKFTSEMCKIGLDLNYFSIYINGVQIHVKV